MADEIKVHLGMAVISRRGFVQLIPTKIDLDPILDNDEEFFNYIQGA